MSSKFSTTWRCEVRRRKSKPKQSAAAAIVAGLLSRLTEPSTYAGLAVLGALFGVKELAQFATPEYAAAAAATAAIFLPGK